MFKRRTPFVARSTGATLLNSVLPNTTTSNTAIHTSSMNGTSFTSFASPFAVQRRYASSGEKDYYSMLGVSKTATKDEIKKAYRKRAMATHPDQGGKPEEFQQVSEAYEVLSNDEKRAMYDQYGSEAASAAFDGGMGHRTAEDIFAEFFGMGMGRRNMKPQVRDVEVAVKVTLEELYTGCSKETNITRPAICSTCRGTGTKSGQEKSKCTKCNGRGRMTQMATMGGNIMQTLVECPECEGSGRVVKPDDMCAKCKGEGYHSESKKITIPIQAGLPGNVALRMGGEGGMIPGATPGDIIVHVQMLQHKMFTRRGDDLMFTTEIKLNEALLGFQRTIKMLDGRTVCVSSPAGEVLQSSTVLKITGEGMPNVHGSKGDLYVFVNVKMPKSLTDDQKAALEKAFGKPDRDPNATSGNTLKARVVRETKEHFMANKSEEWGRQESMGQGGRRRGGGGPQDQCVNQ